VALTAHPRPSGRTSPGPLWEGPDTKGTKLPKLTPARAAEVKKAGEDGAFPVFPIGFTRVKLRDVTTGQSRAGDPMWTWEFSYVEFLDHYTPEKGEEDKPHPTERWAGKTVKYYTVLRDDLLWDLDRVFAAFDADPDTDTDDLLGDEIVVMMDQAMIDKGPAKGNMGNNITRFYTLAEGIAAAEESRAAQAALPTPKIVKPAKSTKSAPKPVEEPAF
jgi:hypothetical protein